MENKVISRSKVTFAIFLTFIFVIFFLTLFNIRSVFFYYTFSLVNILFAFWLYIDEKILQQKELIIKSVLLGLFTIFLNVLMLIKTNIIDMVHPIFMGHTILTFVILQYFLRRLFIKFFKNEPRIIGIAGSFPEVIYSYILLFILLVFVPLTSEYMIKLILR